MSDETTRVSLTPGNAGSIPVSDPALVQTLADSVSINSHRDFYLWLQEAVQAFIPHETLLACWGDFNKTDISFDVASSVPGVTTGSLASHPGLVKAVQRLFLSVQQGGRRWITLNGLHAIVGVGGLDIGKDLYRDYQSDSTALLVHTMRCARDEIDCMYVFAVTQGRHRFNQIALDLLMPHIDLALRRIDCLPEPVCDTVRHTALVVESLSESEHEVLAWVSQGMSNDEIGSILGISHNTVENHLECIFRKLGVSARPQAVRAYVQAGKLAT